jgi:hypothetical protein
MEPVRVRVTRILDFGSIVSIVGIDEETGKSVAVHVDHRPFQAIWDGWKAAGFRQPVAFDAEHLTLDLNIGVDGDDGGEQLTDTLAEQERAA